MQVCPVLALALVLEARAFALRLSRKNGFRSTTVVSFFILGMVVSVGSLVTAFLTALVSLGERSSTGARDLRVVTGLVVVAFVYVVIFPLSSLMRGFLDAHIFHTLGGPSLQREIRAELERDFNDQVRAAKLQIADYYIAAYRGFRLRADKSPAGTEAADQELAAQLASIRRAKKRFNSQAAKVQAEIARGEGSDLTAYLKWREKEIRQQLAQLAAH